MCEHIEKHSANYLFTLLLILGCIYYPDFSITGALAWFCLMIVSLLSFVLILIAVFGGSMSYESEGLIKKIGRLRKKF